jgi:hypothetical protein
MERYSLGQRCENLALDFLMLLLRANQMRNFNRKNILLEASDNFDLLKVLIRADKDVGTISEKKYLELQTWIQEIGKMLGGWIKNS